MIPSTSQAYYVLVIDGQVDVEDERVEGAELTHRPEVVAALGTGVHHQLRLGAVKHLETEAAAEILSCPVEGREVLPVTI